MFLRPFYQKLLKVKKLGSKYLRYTNILKLFRKTIHITRNINTVLKSIRLVVDLVDF